MDINQVPFERIHEIYDIMKRCPQHQFFILTKQAKRMAEIVTKIYQLEAMGHAKGFWDHVWHGVSCCTQDDADRMMPDLLRVPGKRWISYEPAIGPVDFSGYLTKPQWGKADEQNMRPLEIVGRNDLIQWIIVGAESGPRRRPCKIEWVENVVEQCKGAGVPVYIKQIEINGKCVRDIEKFPKHLQVREIP